ncbi:extracellular solute-binding protein [Herbaspirillum robiniae]|uniref:extracellular solute-binding protein n=1 Tax=Herbaspirillum robiniae TaxID=2014887 RepID=UPI003D7815B2
MRTFIHRTIAAVLFWLCRAVLAQPAELSIVSIDNADMQELRRLSTHFERDNPSLRLRWIMLDEHELRQRLQVEMDDGGTRFDVVTAGAYEVQSWARKGRLSPFSELPAGYEAHDLIDDVRRPLTQDCKLQALPFYAEGVLTYFRADLFRRKGLVMPAQPTWDDLERLAAALHDPAAGIAGICLRGRAGWGGNVMLLSAMARARGARWVDEHGRPRLNSQKWKDSVAQYAGLLRDYGPKQALELGFRGNLELFSAGRCGIWVDASAAAGTLQQAMKERRALGVAPAPVTADGRQMSWHWVWALAVPQASRHAAAAKRFAAWASSREYIELVARERGWAMAPPGTRMSTYAQAQYRKAAPFADLALDAVRRHALLRGADSDAHFIATPEFLPIAALTGQAVAVAVAGKMSAATAMELAQLRAERVLRQSGRLP